MTSQTKTPKQKAIGNFFKKGLVNSLIITGLIIPNFIPSKSYSEEPLGFFEKLSAPYGQIKSSKNITKSFENYEIKNDHNYFISGYDQKYPTAILGLHKNFKLSNTKFWRPLNSQNKTLQDLVENMKNKASESDNRPYGANIHHNKKDIGDWYSVVNNTTVKALGDNRFCIYAPDIGAFGLGGGVGAGGVTGGGVTGGGGHSGGDGAGGR